MNVQVISVVHGSLFLDMYDPAQLNVVPTRPDSQLPTKKSDSTRTDPNRPHIILSTMFHEVCK